jgi:trans-aconitate methyltransferase
VGCGSGALSRQIADHVAHIVAIDHNDELIALARRKFPKANLEFQKADALEFVARAKEPFHILILSHLLEHLDNPAQFLLSHVSRFKKTYIEVPDLERSPLNEYRREINSKLQYSDNDHIWEFTRDDMRELITSCGLLIEDSEFRYGVQKYWCSLASSKEHIA